MGGGRRRCATLRHLLSEVGRRARAHSEDIVDESLIGEQRRVGIGDRGKQKRYSQRKLFAKRQGR
eukprot:5142065-Pleurochrysis_carterae.AAC.1